jgi:hypothetical protein
MPDYRSITALEMGLNLVAGTPLLCTEKSFPAKPQIGDFPGQGQKSMQRPAFSQSP